jgi:hypothetical protein
VRLHAPGRNAIACRAATQKPAGLSPRGCTDKFEGALDFASRPKIDPPAGSMLEPSLARRQPGGSFRGTTTITKAPSGAARAETAMRTFAQSVYGDAEFGAVKTLPSAGTALENPYVYDASAQELKAMASQGLVKIVEEHRIGSGSGGLISRLSFERLR